MGLLKTVLMVSIAILLLFSAIFMFIVPHLIMTTLSLLMLLITISITPVKYSQEWNRMKATKIFIIRILFTVAVLMMVVDALYHGAWGAAVSLLLFTSVIFLKPIGPEEYSRADYEPRLKRAKITWVIAILPFLFSTFFQLFKSLSVN